MIATQAMSPRDAPCSRRATIAIRSGVGAPALTPSVAALRRRAYRTDSKQQPRGERAAIGREVYRRLAVRARVDDGCLRLRLVLRRRLRLVNDERKRRPSNCLTLGVLRRAARCNRHRAFACDGGGRRLAAWRCRRRCGPAGSRSRNGEDPITTRPRSTSDGRKSHDRRRQHALHLHVGGLLRRRHLPYVSTHS